MSFLHNLALRGAGLAPRAAPRQEPIFPEIPSTPAETPPMETGGGALSREAGEGRGGVFTAPPSEEPRKPEGRRQPEGEVRALEPSPPAPLPAAHPAPRERGVRQRAASPPSEPAIVAGEAPALPGKTDGVEVEPRSSPLSRGSGRAAGRGAGGEGRRPQTPPSNALPQLDPIPEPDPAIKPQPEPAILQSEPAPPVIEPRPPQSVLTPAVASAPATPEPEEPRIEVRIGRVEIKTAPPPVRPGPAPPKGPKGFREQAAARSYRDRKWY